MLGSSIGESGSFCLRVIDSMLHLNEYLACAAYLVTREAGGSEWGCSQGDALS